MESGKREDLRRLMREKMAAKAVPQQSTSNERVNDSTQSNPFLKVSSSGRLQCTVCPGIPIKTWTTHQFSAEHKRNVKAHRTMRTAATNISKPIHKNHRVTEQTPVLPKEPPRSILKNPLVKPPPQQEVEEHEASQPHGNSGGGLESKQLPAAKNAQIVADTKTPSEGSTPKGSGDAEHTSEMQSGKGQMSTEEEERNLKGAASSLPEGFFDDPRLDAKARNQEYRDPQDVEWEKYQKALREEENKSEQVAEMDDEKHTRERNIYEADEQIHNWEIVRELEICREEQHKKPLSSDGQKASDGDSDDTEQLKEDPFYEEEFDELTSWRQKSIKKIEKSLPS